MLSTELTTTSYVAHAIQFALGAVFLIAATSKLRQPSAFARTIAEYRLLPGSVVPLAAWTLLAAEAFLAVALLTGWLAFYAMPLAIATMLMFVVAVSVNLGRGRRVRCGCFGDDDELLSIRTVVRLVMLVGLAVLVLTVQLTTTTTPLQVTRVVADGATLTYGLPIAALAAFLLLFGNWLLHLPELGSVLRGLAGPGADKTEELSKGV